MNGFDLSDISDVRLGNQQCSAIFYGVEEIWPLHVPVGSVLNYGHTGTVQQVELPRGVYKFQCWGAQGGSNPADANYGISSQNGAKGGYSEGILTIDTPTILYIFVGGQPSTSSTNGGWNGGGGGGGSTSKGYVFEAVTLTAGRTNQYISNTGAVTSLTNGYVSAPIYFDADTKLAFTARSSTVVGMISKTNSGGTSYTPVVVGEGSGALLPVQEVFYTVTEAGYYAFSWYDTGTTPPALEKADVYGLGTSRMGRGGGATDIALVSSSMNYSSYRTNRSSASLLSRIIVAGGGSGGAMGYNALRNYNARSLSLTVAQSNKYVRKTGSVASLNYGYISTPVYLNNGDVVMFTGRSSTDVAVISQTNSGGTSFTPVLVGTGSGSSIPQNTYGYVVTASGYYAFSWYDTGSNPPTCSVKEKTTAEDTDTSNGYVGGGVTGGGYANNYKGKQNGAGLGGGFGYGGNDYSTVRYSPGCGGGGWYGGGRSGSNYDLYSVDINGGGSGFVNIAANASYRPTGYTGVELDSGETKDGTQTFEAPGGGTETGHAGNGYARITRIS